MTLGEMFPWRKKAITDGRTGEKPLQALRHEIDQILDRFGWGETAAEKSLSGFRPSVDVVEKEKEILITAELPGVEEKDLEVYLSNGNLVIRGEKRMEQEEKGEHYYRKESSFGSFQRTIPLVSEVEEDKVDATFSKGILKVRIPKTDEARRSMKKIEIH